MDIGDTHSTSRDCLGNTQVIHTLVIYFFITIKPPPLRCSTCSLVVIGTVISLDRSDFIDTIQSASWASIEHFGKRISLEDRALHKQTKLMEAECVQAVVVACVAASITVWELICSHKLQHLQGLPVPQ